MNRTATATPPFIVLFILVGLFSMFAASFQSLLESPVPDNAPARPAARDSGSQPPDPSAFSGPSEGDTSLALTEKQADAITELMRRLQADRNDAETLTEIGEIYLVAQQWPRAESFLTRAINNSPEDIRPRYMMGLCLYQQGKVTEAASAYEELLAIKEDPTAQYNLALIYKHRMGQEEKACELLNRVIASPASDVDLINKAKKEREGC